MLQGFHVTALDGEGENAERALEGAEIITAFLVPLDASSSTLRLSFYTPQSPRKMPVALPRASVCSRGLRKVTRGDEVVELEVLTEVELPQPVGYGPCQMGARMFGKRFARAS